MDQGKIDSQVKVIREFVEFARDVDKSKGVKNMHALVVKPKTLSDSIKVKLVEEARKCFTTVNFNRLTDKDVFVFKTGSINLGKLESKLDGEDLETFEEFTKWFRTMYEEDTAAVDQLLGELDIETDSPEADFLRKIFNEIGQDFMDMVKSHQDDGEFDINALLPRVAMLFKSGKLTNLMSDFGDSGVRMSKILFAVGKLLQKYEDNAEMDGNNEDKEGVSDKNGESSESD